MSFLRPINAKSLFRPAGPNYIPARDVEATAAWYIEKFDLRRISVELDDGENCVALSFSKQEEDLAFVVGPAGVPTDGSTPMLNASNLDRARDLLSSRGVNGDDIRQDRQGTHFLRCAIWKAM